MIELTFTKSEVYESPLTYLITRNDDQSVVLTIDLSYNPENTIVSVYEGEASNAKTVRIYFINDSDPTTYLINFIEYINDYMISYQMFVGGNGDLKLSDITRINKFTFRIVRRVMDCWSGGSETL